MANGIKLRRGLKTALAGTIADGEFVFCTDSGELGFKKGTVEKYVDLEKLSTDIDELQTEVDELQSNTPSLFKGQFKHKVDLFYDYNVDDRPANEGNYLIPIAIVNPAFADNNRSIAQVIYFRNQLISSFIYDSYGSVAGSEVYFLDYIVIETVSDPSGNYSLEYKESISSSNFGCEILNDGRGNLVVCVVTGAITNKTDKIRISFEVDCISVESLDVNNSPYYVFLPPTGIPVISIPGES